MTDYGWNPWAVLRSRTDIELLICKLAGETQGLTVTESRRPSVIMLSHTLTQTERKHVLAHELVHVERGGGCPFDPTREERRVEDEAVRRLVPLSALHAELVRRESAGVTYEPWEIAEDWHVPEVVARRALELLYARIRDRL